jgi:hypothetical protein
MSCAIEATYKEFIMLKIFLKKIEHPDKTISKTAINKCYGNL